jgi:hypothetical protein
LTQSYIEATSTILTEYAINISQENDTTILPSTHQLSEFKPTQSVSDLESIIHDETTPSTTLQQQIEPLSSESVANPTESSSTHHFLVPDHTAITNLNNQVSTWDHQTSSSFLVSLTTCATATIGFLAALAFALAILIPLFNYVKKQRFALH